MTTTGLSVLLGLGQAACVTISHDSLPSEWSSTKSRPTDEGCPNLAGTYDNRAVAAFPEGIGDWPTLSETFTRMGAGQGIASPAASKRSWPAIPSNPQSVSISQTAKTVAVGFVDETDNKTSLAFRPYHFGETRLDDLFVCHTTHGEPWLQFWAATESHGSVAAPIAVGGGGTNILLLKAVDGSLIVRWLSDSVGLTVVGAGSSYKSDSVWYRYPLLKTSRSD
jgi:hypothetical protein